MMNFWLILRALSGWVEGGGVGPAPWGLQMTPQLGGGGGCVPRHPRPLIKKKPLVQLMVAFYLTTEGMGRGEKLGLLNTKL